MKPTGDEFLRSGLGLLGEEARPFVERMMSETYGDDWIQTVKNDRGLEKFSPDTTDPMTWLKVIRKFWRGTFEEVLKPYRRDTAGEILSLRNMYYHHEPLDIGDVRRGLGNIKELLVDMQNERIDRIDRLIRDFETSVGGQVAVPKPPSTSAVVDQPVAVGELQFETGAIRGGRLMKGYRPDWHWSRGGGSYQLGRDFLWLEYEVHEPERVVRVQVESPTHTTDPDLNSRKLAIFEQLVSLGNSVDRPLVCQVAQRASEDAVRRYKSTTVLQVRSEEVSGAGAWEEEAARLIESVHVSIGSDLARAWSGGAIPD